MLVVEFNSWDLKHKSPFGAVSCDTSVSFSLFAEECDNAYLCIQNGNELSMKQEGDWFHITLTPKDAGLVFYYFKLHSIYGPTFYCGRGDGGSSSCTDDIPNPWQLTVYQKTPEIPDWYKKGIVYQIFPDRFHIGGEINRAKKDAHYREWTEAPTYIRAEDNSIKTWDFYGGNLKGVTEKLPYLKSLGVTCIYLNPIFESSSNHRYSTADYKKIDNILGDETDFAHLIAEADKSGIKIILDGVFNHVGADSIYFNRFGHYDSIGAYQSEKSKYYPWFRFNNFPDDYECWWGVTDLPDLEENNEGLRKFLLTDPDSVIRKWTKFGIGGWRLDVADELPDDFLALLFKTVKEENQNAIVMGEVWEDASNKVAYDTLRKYFTHRELDCVMNYPFRDSMFDFFRGNINAYDLKNRFMTQMENYPESAFLCNLNLLGTHDTARIRTMTDEIAPDHSFELLTQLVALQFTFPGVPSVYYGDEAGVTGGKDPDNRKPYPWGNEDTETVTLYQKYMTLRAHSDILKNGTTEFIALSDDVFGVKRTFDGNTHTLHVNRSDFEQATVPAHGIKEE
ncbi:MAG: glycoside hydrolase family 13 protein, partial [Clostridia bacterium]|nr:glycoside hydrolase family 13 protein [Clostridia bacterium]